MERTISIDELKAVVEAYILDRKGVKIKIVFQNPKLYDRHLKLLYHAYDVARAYYENKK